MRILKDDERILLANLVTRDDWKLAMEVMEDALQQIQDAHTSTNPRSSDKDIANSFRTFCGAKMFYDAYIQGLQKEIQRIQAGTILPDITEGILGTKPNEP